MRWSGSRRICANTSRRRSDHRRPKWCPSVDVEVPASQRTREELTVLIEGRLSTASARDELVKLATQACDAVGQHYYEHGARAAFARCIASRMIVAPDVPAVAP